MNPWRKLATRLYSVRLYFVAIGLFCYVLLLLETSNLLPKRQLTETLSTTPLPSINATRLNMSQMTEFIGVIATTTASTTAVKVSLPITEKDLLTIGDILIIPDIGYGVVVSKTMQSDSVFAAVELEVVVETDNLSSGESVHLYR